MAQCDDAARHRVAGDQTAVREQAVAGRALSRKAFLHALEGEIEVGSLPREDRAQPDLAVQDAFAALAAVAQAHHARRLRIASRQASVDVVLHVVEAVVPPGAEQLHAPPIATRMVHEVAADQIQAVAQASGLHPIARKQQARVLDAAGGKHVVARTYREFLARQGAGANGGHTVGGIVGVDRHHVRPQYGLDVGGASELIAKVDSEPHRRRQQRHRILYARVTEVEAPVPAVAQALFPPAQVVMLWIDAQQPFGLGEPRIEGGEWKWPAAVAHPRTILEVPIVPPAAEAAPAVAVAAQEAATEAGTDAVGNAAIESFVQVDVALVGTEASALQKAYAETAGGQPKRE